MAPEKAEGGSLSCLPPPKPLGTPANRVSPRLEATLSAPGHGTSTRLVEPPTGIKPAAPRFESRAPIHGRGLAHPIPRRERAPAKAERLLTSGFVRVVALDERGDAAVLVRGDHGVYRVTRNNSFWRCPCPAYGPCSHARAANLVVLKP
jgi:hypothetical protein